MKEIFKRKVTCIGAHQGSTGAFSTVFFNPEFETLDLPIMLQEGKKYTLVIYND